MGCKHPILPLLLYSFSVKEILTSNVSSFCYIVYCTDKKDCTLVQLIVSKDAKT